MECPVCESKKTRIIDSRYVDSAKKRRRACDCGHKWTTYELIMDKAEFERLMNKENRTGKPWTEQNDDELQFLFEDGLTLNEIAVEIGRSYDAVDRRVRRLGLRRKRDLRKLNKLLDNKDFLEALNAIK